MERRILKIWTFWEAHIVEKKYSSWFWRLQSKFEQSYIIKSPPWTILWFRILGIFFVENIKRFCVFMFQTWDHSQLLRRVLWISVELTIVSSLKHKNMQPLYIFNSVRRGLDYIALPLTALRAAPTSCQYPLINYFSKYDENAYRKHTIEMIGMTPWYCCY